MFKIRNNVFETNSSTVHTVAFSNKSFNVKVNLHHDLLNVFMQDYDEEPKIINSFEEKINYLFSLNIYYLMCYEHALYQYSDELFLWDEDHKKIHEIIKLLEKYINGNLSNDYIETKKYYITITDEFKQFVKIIKNITNCKKIKLNGIPNIPHESVSSVQEFLNDFKIDLKTLLENENVTIFTDSYYCNSDYSKINTVKNVSLDDVVNLIDIGSDYLIYNKKMYAYHELDKLLDDIELSIDGFIDRENYQYLCFKIGEKIGEKVRKQNV